MEYIGIDLGTTHSCVAICDNGNPVVFEIDSSMRTTPSQVAFNDTEFMVGIEAKNYSCEDPRNTVYDTKRLIGRLFHDGIVQNMKNWPFEVINNNGKPQIKVTYLGNDTRIYPEEISSMILAQMKKIAEEKTGRQIKNAVITVPAYFNEMQKQSTKDAAVIAGLNVLKLINEPTAAALAYTYSQQRRKNTKLLAYDFGGGTFDVSILTINKGAIIVKAVNGDTHLGGADFDCRMVDHFVEVIKKEYKTDLKDAKYKNSVAKLRIACEFAKKTLYNQLKTKISIQGLFDGRDFDSSITRTKRSVQNALRDAHLNASDMDEILLVGGSTRIPKIQEMLLIYFNKPHLNKTINPDEAVALGAAIQASLLSANSHELLAGLVCDVTPLSYGIETKGGLNSIIIPRNTRYPVKCTTPYVTVADNQTRMRIRVCQGDRPIAENNFMLNEFTIYGLPMKFAEEVEVLVTMDIDDNGMLTVSATEFTTGVQASISIGNEMKNLTTEQIIESIAKSEQMKRNDEIRKARIEARNKLEWSAYELKRCMNREYCKMDHPVYLPEEVLQLTRKIKKWLDENPNATKAMIESQYDHLMNFKQQKGL